MPEYRQAAPTAKGSPRTYRAAVLAGFCFRARDRSALSAASRSSTTAFGTDKTFFTAAEKRSKGVGSRGIDTSLEQRPDEGHGKTARHLRRGHDRSYSDCVMRSLSGAVLPAGAWLLLTPPTEFEDYGVLEILASRPLREWTHESIEYPSREACEEARKILRSAISDPRDTDDLRLNSAMRCLPADQLPR